MNCRMCESSKVEKFLDLGNIPLVDRFLTAEELNKTEKLFPLNVHICTDCGLVQLGYVVPAKELFNENYAYEAGITKGRRQNHFELAEYTCNKFKITQGSLVVDIGSNVGVLLEGFKNLGMRVLGVDASVNVVKIANSKGIETINGFFDENMVEKILSNKPKPRVITATNLFAHIQDYPSFIKSVKELLRDDGIFVFQVPHFLQLINHVEYDTIYHEHISYFGLKPLIRFFNKFDMELFDVIETDIDGGSIRCFVAKKGIWKISSNVERLLKKEMDAKIYSLETLQKFAIDVERQKEQLVNLLVSLKDEKKHVVGISAPAKGITLLNYCKIGTKLLSYVTEKSSLKIGKFTPGMHIPVVPDEKLLEDVPDYALILAWNFEKEIIKNLDEYHNKGGKFIIPIPCPKIVE